MILPLLVELVEMFSTHAQDGGRDEGIVFCGSSSSTKLVEYQHINLYFISVKKNNVNDFLLMSHNNPCLVTPWCTLLWLQHCLSPCPCSFQSLLINLLSMVALYKQLVCCVHEVRMAQYIELARAHILCSAYRVQ